MAQNFLACDREQALLVPPDMRDWLPADHLARFVLDVVDVIDITKFPAAYRQDGWDRAAFDAAMSQPVASPRTHRGRRTPRSDRARILADLEHFESGSGVTPPR